MTAPQFHVGDTVRIRSTGRFGTVKTTMVRAWWTAYAVHIVGDGIHSFGEDDLEPTGITALPRPRPAGPRLVVDNTGESQP